MPNTSTSTITAAVHVNELDECYNFHIVLGSSWQEKMNSCNACECCLRHTMNKPRILGPHKYYRKNNIEHWWNTKNPCDCPCRRLARAMLLDHIHDIITASPEPCDLPMPPSTWTN